MNAAFELQTCTLEFQRAYAFQWYMYKEICTYIMVLDLLQNGWCKVDFHENEVRKYKVSEFEWLQNCCKVLGPFIHLAKDHNPFIFQQQVPRSTLTFTIHLLRHLAELTKLAEVCKIRFPNKTTNKRSVESPIDGRSKKTKCEKVNRKNTSVADRK